MWRTTLRCLVPIGLLAVFASAASCSTGDTAPVSGVASSTATSSPAAERSPGCANPKPPVSEVSLVVDGTERHALVDVPPTGDPVPLILSFHGAGQSADLQVAIDQFTDRGRSPALVVRPSGLPLFDGVTGWNVDLDGVDEIAFVTALLDRMEADYCVDRNRLYAAGISSGGAMAELVACSIPRRIAAVALVSPLSMSRPCAADTPVPIIAFRGVRDLLLPYEGTHLGLTTTFGFEQWAGEWAARNGCAPGAHFDRPTGRVQPLSWSGCEAATAAYRLYGYGHTWPHATRAAGDLTADAFLSGCAQAKTQQYFQSIGITCEEGIANLFLSPPGYSATDEILRFFDANPRTTR